MKHSVASVEIIYVQSTSHHQSSVCRYIFDTMPPVTRGVPKHSSDVELDKIKFIGFTINGLKWINILDFVTGEGYS